MTAYSLRPGPMQRQAGELPQVRKEARVTRICVCRRVPGRSAVRIPGIFSHRATEPQSKNRQIHLSTDFADNHRIDRPITLHIASIRMICFYKTQCSLWQMPYSALKRETQCDLKGAVGVVGALFDVVSVFKAQRTDDSP